MVNVSVSGYDGAEFIGMLSDELTNNGFDVGEEDLLMGVFGDLGIRHADMLLYIVINGDVFAESVYNALENILDQIEFTEEEEEIFNETLLDSGLGKIENSTTPVLLTLR